MLSSISLVATPPVAISIAATVLSPISLVQTLHAARRSAVIEFVAAISVFVIVPFWISELSTVF